MTLADLNRCDRNDCPLGQVPDECGLFQPVYKLLPPAKYRYEGRPLELQVGIKLCVKCMSRLKAAGIWAIWSREELEAMIAEAEQRAGRRLPVAFSRSLLDFVHYVPN